MRTTVTIDDNVEHLLKDRIRRTHSSFKETLNQALRKGLSESHVRLRRNGHYFALDRPQQYYHYSTPPRLT